MITKNISRMLLVALITILLPNTASAYFTQGQTQLQVTPTSAMYTITYAFGLPKQDLYMPVIAERNLLHRKDNNTLGYTMQDTDKNVVTFGDAAGVVISDAEIRDGMYFVPKGTAQSFTLVVFFRTYDGTPQGDYLLQVENLPFLVDMGDPELEIRGLNPSELQYYVTDEVTLNQSKKVIETLPEAIEPNGK